MADPYFELHGRYARSRPHKLVSLDPVQQAVQPSAESAHVPPVAHSAPHCSRLHSQHSPTDVMWLWSVHCHFGSMLV